MSELEIQALARDARARRKRAVRKSVKAPAKPSVKRAAKKAAKAP
jgi:hypothetical protein